MPSHHIKHHSRHLTSQWRLRSVITEHSVSRIGTLRKLMHLQQALQTVLHIDLPNGFVSSVDHDKETEVAKARWHAPRDP